MKTNRMTKICSRIDKLLSVFTNLVKELENAILELRSMINKNNEIIDNLQEDNDLYLAKIGEYESLKLNIERIVH